MINREKIIQSLGKSILEAFNKQQDICVYHTWCQRCENPVPVVEGQEHLAYYDFKNKLCWDCLVETVRS